MGTGMILDGIAASEAVDSAGEILDVEGCDISDLEDGKGVLNWEHRGDDAPGASPNDIVGRITYAKKVFKRSDCEDARQEMYWDMVKLPYIYIRCRLFDGSDHPGAKALAAIIRDYKANGEPILVRYSIEGSTLLSENHHLKRSVARRIAATIKPANKSCHSDVLEDPNAPAGPEKYDDKPKDILEIEDAKKAEHEHPVYARLGGSYEVECDPECDETLLKTYTAGVTSGAPGTLTGGAALQREDESLRRSYYKNQFLAALRDYRKDSFDKSEFRTFLKNRLPEASDHYIDRFADLAEDYRVKLKKALDVRAEPEPAVGTTMRDLFPDPTVLRMEKLTIDLTQALKNIKPGVISFAGKLVLPGQADVGGKKHALLYEDEHQYVAVPGTPENFDPAELVRLPKAKEGRNYLVTQKPAVMVDGKPYQLADV